MQGIVLGLTVLITKSTSVALTVEGPAKAIFGDFLFGGQLQAMAIWWLVLTAIYIFFVHVSPWGNWIFAMGGDKVSARNAGIPTDRLTVILFVLSATSAAFVGMCQAILYNSAQVAGGQSFIFNAIISVVVGGVLLTGGFGSVVGIFFGTITFAIVTQGIYYTDFDRNWSFAHHRCPAAGRGPDEQHLPQDGAVLQPAQRRQAMTAPILALRGVNKSFGPIDVLHDITLEVKAGEVLCLLGDNGAGKSTLIKIMSGVHHPTSGQIEMDGSPVSFATPRAASERGIATVHQFGGTFPLMSIGRSFFIGVEPTRGWGPFRMYDRKTANAIAVKAVQDFGITRIDDGDRLVGGLSGGERQSLAIARAVHFGARVLILDEPTAALGVKQATHVLRIVNEAKRRGLAVVFITHQVMHAMAVGDHFAVLIRGAVAADFKKGDKTREEITDLMAGGASMASLEAEIDGYMASHDGHPPPPAH